MEVMILRVLGPGEGATRSRFQEHCESFGNSWYTYKEVTRTPKKHKTDKEGKRNKEDKKGKHGNLRPLK
eukprot:2813018-Amphidinium_carterae.2